MPSGSFPARQRLFGYEASRRADLGRERHGVGSSQAATSAGKRRSLWDTAALAVRFLFWSDDDGCEAQFRHRCPRLVGA